MCGVRKLGYSMSRLGRTDEKMKFYEPFFVFYWGFCIKFLIPSGLQFILVSIIKTDLVKPYGGYGIHW